LAGDRARQHDRLVRLPQSALNTNHHPSRRCQMRSGGNRIEHQILQRRDEEYAGDQPERLVIVVEADEPSGAGPLFDPQVKRSQNKKESDCYSKPSQSALGERDSKQEENQQSAVEIESEGTGTGGDETQVVGVMSTALVDDHRHA